MVETVSYEVADGVATLTLNRPERRNAMNREMVDAVLARLGEAAGDDEVRVVVLTGAGDAFCVGGDLAAGPGGGIDGSAPESFLPGFRASMRSSQLLHEMPKVTVAAINGACAGAGFSWACACDLRVAATSARFSTAFARAGVSGDYGGTWTLPRIVGPAKARELYLLSPRFGADAALDLGLITEMIPDGEFTGRVREFAAQIAAGPPLAQAAIKANLLDAERLSFTEALDHEARRHLTTALTKDATEAAAAFLDKREPRFTGH